MITPIGDEQSILSAIDRFVACLGEDKATVANYVNQYIHLETHAAARFDIVNLRARLPVDAVNIIIAHHKPSTWTLSKACLPKLAKASKILQISGSALVFFLHTFNAGRQSYTALYDLTTRCPNFEDARPLLQEQADIWRASNSKTQGVDKHAQGIILHDINTVLNRLRTIPVPPPSPEQERSEKAKHTAIDDNLDDISTTLHKTVLQPAAASSEDNQSLQNVQQPSLIGPDPLDWGPFEVDLPPHPDRSAPYNLSSSSDDIFAHQNPDRTSSAIEERFKHYKSLDYNSFPIYIDVRTPSINSSG